MKYRKVITTGETADMVECEGLGSTHPQDILSEKTSTSEEQKRCKSCKYFKKLKSYSYCYKEFRPTWPLKDACSLYTSEELEDSPALQTVRGKYPVGEIITGVEEIDSAEIIKNFDECIQFNLSKIFSEKGWDLDLKSAYNGYLEGISWVLSKIKKKQAYE